MSLQGHVSDTMPRHATALETVSVTVPEAAVEAYEAALASVCGTVGLFVVDERDRSWRVEGVKGRGEQVATLDLALAIAAAATGHAAALTSEPTASEGWLARTRAAFPEQRIGRFAVRGEHLPAAAAPGRITLTLDAGVAFGSGEHGSTRGCLRALERVAARRSRGRLHRILDLGTGSGILAMAAARLLGRPVLAVDIDPWSVRTTRANARRNGLPNRVQAGLADGWASPAVRRAAPYDLVFANILARPLCRMARPLAAHLASGGTAILAGLLDEQARAVLAAHRRCGLTLDFSLQEERWTTLVLRQAR